MVKFFRKKSIFLLCALGITTYTLTGCRNLSNDNAKNIEIVNVSYDPTRELFEEYNKEFAKYWKGIKKQEVIVIQSHGGSGSQGRSVIEGSPADVVTLALGYDITAIEKEGLIEPGWQSEFADNSAPYTSTIVFLVRKGNPKNIKDWSDLIREEVGVITPNPKTSGGARWNYLAAWAYAEQLYEQDEKKVKEFISKLYKNVLVLDSGARGATTTFVENKQGDVLISWENEAYLSLEEYPGEYEIISPSISVLAEPPVAVVDEVAERNDSEEVSKAYLEYLYSDIGQQIVAKYYYRPRNAEILNQYKDVFDLDIDLVTIDDALFGGWDKVQEKHFADGGVFDQIYESN